MAHATHDPAHHHPTPWSELLAWRTILDEADAMLEAGQVQEARGRLQDARGVLATYLEGNPAPARLAARQGAPAAATVTTAWVPPGKVQLAQAHARELRRRAGLPGATDADKAQADAAAASLAQVLIDEGQG